MMASSLTLSLSRSFSLLLSRLLALSDRRAMVSAGRTDDVWVWSGGGGGGGGGGGSGGGDGVGA